MSEPTKKPLSEKQLLHLANMRMKASEERAQKKAEKEQMEKQSFEEK